MSHFNEVSRLPAVILVLFVLNFLIFGAIYWYRSSPAMLGVAALVFLVGLLLVVVKLSVSITPEGINYKLAPFHFNLRHWDWEQVQKAELLKISALADFGGWGLRYSKTHGWGYITQGDWGLKVKTSDGQKFVVSINRPEELRRFLKEHHLESRVVF